MPKKRNYKLCEHCETPIIGKRNHAKYCSDSCRALSKQTTEGQYKRISGNWELYVNRLIWAGGKKRKSLTPEMVLSILEAQDYKCALTGVELTCLLEKGKDFPTNVSIDRIEAGGPYIPDNIQLVCKAVNKFRSNLPLDEFIWWCNKVVETNGQG